MPIELSLDLREFTRRIEDPAAFLSFWGQLSPSFSGRALERGRSYSLKHELGVVRFTVISNPDPAKPVSGETQFAVHSVIEPPEIRYSCDHCRARQKISYGPFLCQPCKSDRRDGRVCDEHVVILDGSMRSTCFEHVPNCACGKRATFWCQGPECRRSRAWCDTHRKRQQHDQDHSYCDGCYAILFPACAQTGCANVGSLRCEFTDQRTLQPCGQHLCPNHMQRWQVYGPEQEGIALCNRHRGIRALSDNDLIFQIVTATAARRIRSRRSPWLPTLQSVRHILRKARNKTYDLANIARLFETFPPNLAGVPALNREAAALLEAHAKRRRTDLERDKSDKDAGAVYFERVRQALISKGQLDLASSIRFSDYRPKQNRLFVIVPDAFKGLFIGKGGRDIKDLSLRAGVDVNIEKTGQ